jgi:octaprenyl-diphosphate synthase
MAHEALKGAEMTTVETPRTRPDEGAEVMARLNAIAADRGADTLADKLHALRSFIDDDLRQVEAELARIERRDTPLHNSAHHLLAMGGKRLRPLCVALASRVGDGFSPSVRAMAVAVEVVHNATLLHDDVVDLGELRRGAPAARMVYGNAASIFAGDWLLVEALDRIQRAGVPELLVRMIATLKEMLDAESLQLANRGSMRGSVQDYFRVVEGKTASLFGWGLFAGARAARVELAHAEALERFGRKVGVCFQLVDDMLDVAGDAAHVGKTVFSDLREGKATYPLLLAVERDPELAAMMEAAMSDGLALDPALERRAARALKEGAVLEQCRTLATKLTTEGLAELETLPPSRARDALAGVAMTLLHRTK